MIKYNEIFDTNTATGLMNMIFNARTFWRDAAFWMQSYIISYVEELEIKDAISQTLRRTPSGFGNTMRLFFGDQVTNNYTSYLTDYLIALESFIAAVKSGDRNAANQYLNQLRSNINTRAAMLAQINPFWSENEWKNLFNRFLDLLVQQLETYLSKDYTRYVDMFERLLSHTTRMGDYYSDGLYKYLTYSAQQPLMPKQCY
ncbi:MAG: hypothetical protein AAGU75_03370 [Bacillota bacterium]